MTDILFISGKTVDGRLVLGGVGDLCFTRGIPLELILHRFKDKSYVVDWIDYIETAIRDGHKPSTIKSRIEAAVGDIYGRNYSGELMNRINQII